MVTLSEEAKEAITKQVNESIKEFRQTIFLLNSFKWIAGVLIALFSLGTYKGIDLLIENRVNVKLGYYYEFMNVKAYIGQAEYYKAYELILSAKEKLEKEDMMSPTLQRIYFSNLITILANMNVYNLTNKRFEGVETWEELNRNKDFQKELNSLSTDYYSSIRLNLCKIKFDDNTKTLAAINSIEEISNTQNTPSSNESEYPDRFWYPFIVNVIKKDSIKAKSFRDSLIAYQSSFFNKYTSNKHVNPDLMVIDYWSNVNNKVNLESKHNFILRLEKAIGGIY